MKTKLHSSTAALTAAAIRKELKENFPGMIFRVTCSNFSGGNAVDIYWENGPVVFEVEKLAGKYQYGHFNSQTDIYENSNRQNHPQVKYVQFNRSKSQEVIDLKSELQEWAQNTGDYPETLLHRIFAQKSFPANVKVTGLERIPNTSGTIDKIYNFTFTL